MAAPLRIDELTALGSLSAGAAVAVVQGGLTLQTTASAFITQAPSFTQSGIATTSHRASRTVQAKVSEVEISVLDALNSSGSQVAGDGVTDDTTGIQRAIDTGKRVVVPEGYTFITQGLTVATAKQKIVIRGILKLKNSTNQSVFTVSANRVKFYFEGGEIDGNKSNQTTSTDSFGSGIWIADGVDDVEVWDPYIHDTKRNGVAGAGNNDRCAVIGGEINDVGFIGVYPSQGSGSPSKHWQISGISINTPTQDGIGTVGVQHATISGNRIVSPGVGGIVLEANCHRTSVFGNSVLGVGALDVSTGIQVNDSKRVTITGNTVTSCGAGITVSGDNTSQGVSVVGNTVEDCGYNASGSINFDTSVASSYLSAYQYGVVCSGNIVRDSYRAGIYVNAIAGAIISDNEITDWNLAVDSTTNRYMGGIVLRSGAHDCTVADNRIRHTAAGNYTVGIMEVNDGGNSPSRNSIRYNQITGPTQDVLVLFHASTQSDVIRPTRNTSAPSTGTWARGQIQYHSYPAAAGAIGWVSTDTRGGTFSAYSSTGDITTGTAALTVASSAGLHCGMSITVAGAGAASADLNTVITNVNHSTGVVTLLDNAGTTVDDAAVTPYNPTFKTWGAIAA